MARFSIRRRLIRSRYAPEAASLARRTSGWGADPSRECVLRAQRLM